MYQLINNKIISSPMSNNNNDSLLGFLKKKSLFNNTPTKNSRKRSRSKSRDSRNYEQRSNYNSFEGSLEENLQYSNSRPYPSEQPGRFQQQQQQSRNNMPYPYESNRFSMHPAEAKTSNAPKYNVDTIKESRVERERDRAVDQKLIGSGVGNNVWTGLMTYSGSFESARVDSFQCLQDLTSKIGNQIAGINYKIDSLNNKMNKMLTNELRTVREKILLILDSVFKESDRYIKEYMKRKEQQLAGDLIKIRQLLQHEQEKIDLMKDGLTKPQWKKVAGEILSTDLDSRIEEILKKSHEMQVGQWELHDIGSARIRNIQKELKEILQLQS